MKILSKRIKIILIASVTVLFALIFLFMNNSKIYCAPNSDGITVTEKSESGEKVFFSDVVQPRWFTSGAPIFYVDEDYSFKDSGEYAIKNALEPVSRKFISSGISASTGAINEENYFLYATDSTGIEKKLLPVTEEEEWVNETAQHSVVIRFDYKRVFPSNITFNNDSRKLKDVKNKLTIPGCNTKVNTGKILYRTGKTTAEMNDTTWSYIDLEDGATLNFNGYTQITICIIYEIYEKGSNAFLYAYHQCIAKYCLEVSS